MEKDCLFCKIIAGEIPSYKFLEDENFVAMLDINPNNLGHSLVIPKEHSLNLFEMSEETLGKIGPFIQKTARAVKDGLKANGINLGMNNGSVAGQLIEHSHIHVIPRFVGDGLVHWKPKTGYTPEDFTQTLEKIKASL